MRIYWLLMVFLVFGCVKGEVEETTPKKKKMQINVTFVKDFPHEENYCVTVRGELHDEMKCGSIENIESEEFWGWGYDLCMDLNVHPEKTEGETWEQVCFFEMDYQQVRVMKENGVLKLCSPRNEGTLRFASNLPICPV
jgi:hypothetical protein